MKFESLHMEDTLSGELCRYSVVCNLGVRSTILQSVADSYHVLGVVGVIRSQDDGQGKSGQFVFPCTQIDSRTDQFEFNRGSLSRFAEWYLGGEI